MAVCYHYEFVFIFSQQCQVLHIYIASFSSLEEVSYHIIHHSLYWIYYAFISLQCFDAVGWAAGRASGL